MRVRNKRVLKNGTVAGYVQQKDGSWKWRFIGGSKKTTKKKTTTKKRGGMLRAIVPNGLRARLGYKTNAQIAAQRAERNRQERITRKLAIIHELNQRCPLRRTNIPRGEIDDYVNGLTNNFRTLSHDNLVNIYCQLREYSDSITRRAGNNTNSEELNKRMIEITDILVNREMGNNRGRNQPRNEPINAGNHPRNTVNGQGAAAARGGRRTRKTKTRKTKTRKTKTRKSRK